ncbi:MAG: hypothetical protein NTX03_14290 [Bacteroidetes bacterium]|nr:hypothetical protein [Bacteroidota bacterium]
MAEGRVTALDFELTEDIKNLIAELETVNDFAGYYKLSHSLFEEERRRAGLSRMMHYMPPEASSEDEQEIVMVINGFGKPKNTVQQKAANVFRILQFPEEKANERINFNYLKKLHKVAVAKLPEEADAAKFREKTSGLFGINRVEDDSLPNPNDYAAAFNQLTDNHKLHPLIKAWMVYYFIRAIKPFYTENELIASSVCYNILEAEGYGFNSLLKLEKYVWHSKRMMAYNISNFESQDFETRMRANLTSYITISLQGMLTNVKIIEELYFNKLKEKAGMKDATPQQLNNFNFWMDVGFPIHREKLENLNTRQEEIIWQVCNNSTITTNQLMGIFNVAEDVINSDFAKLIGMGILTITGNSGLSFDYKSHTPDAAIEYTFTF